MLDMSGPLITIQFRWILTHLVENASFWNTMVSFMSHEPDHVR